MRSIHKTSSGWNDLNERRRKWMCDSSFVRLSLFETKSKFWSLAFVSTILLNSPMIIFAVCTEEN